MSNYKIIENRPELTSAQVLGGMNFAVVKAGALATTTTIAGVIITKGLITKLFITAVVLSSSVWLYNADHANDNTDQASVTKAMVKPNHYGEKKAVLKETAQVTSTSIKPIRIRIPAIPPQNKKEEQTEVTTNAVPSLTSQASLITVMPMPTIGLTNPGPAVCQPHRSTPAFNTVNILQEKDSVK